MKKLLSVEEVKTKIKNGDKLLLAGDESQLAQLPSGNWIGGTIPYFMGEDGGVFTKDLIYVDELPADAKSVRIVGYDFDSMPGIARDEFDNGFTILIVPAFSRIHQAFAEDGGHYENIFNAPLTGWIAGVDLAEIGVKSPKTFDGRTLASSSEGAVAMHVELPADKVAMLDIINLFTQGEGDTLTFDETGFKVGDCYVNGEKRNFAEYLAEKKVDTRLPLVANYCGAMINTSFNAVDAASNTVSLYAPVFKHVEYKIAKPVDDYVKAFSDEIEHKDIEPVFSCNCILNYLYSELEGKKTAHVTGPVTFGEIAYQLLNQTMVYVQIQDV